MSAKLPIGWWYLPALLLSGCTLSQEFSRTPRTAVEQLLLTEAVERSLKDLTAPLPGPASLHVDVTGLQTDRAHFKMVGDDRGVLHEPSLDLLLIRDAVATGLAKLGHRIEPRDSEPAYLARVVVESFGTTQGLTFLGMPPVQSVVIPFALPALTLYGLEGQKGYARLHIDFFDYQSGRLVGTGKTSRSSLKAKHPLVAPFLRGRPHSSEHDLDKSLRSLAFLPTSPG